MSRAINLLPPSSPLHGLISRTVKQWWAVWACTGVFYLALSWQLHRDEKALAAEASYHRAWLDEASRLEKEVRATSLARVSLRQERARPLALLHGFPTLPFFQALVDSIEKAGNSQVANASSEHQRSGTSAPMMPSQRVVIDSIEVEPKTPERSDLFQVSLVATCPNTAIAQEFTKQFLSRDWIIETRRPSIPQPADSSNSCVLTLELFGDQP